jgi:DNA-binding protein H-NS
LWKKIEAWGRDTGLLSINYQSAASDTAYKIKNNRELSDTDRSKAMTIYEIVCENNIELLEEADELTEQEKAEQSAQTETATTEHGITIELLQKMVDWDKRRRILKDWQWNMMNDIVSGKKPLSDRLACGCKQNLKTLKQHGFTED